MLTVIWAQLYQGRVIYSLGPIRNVDTSTHTCTTRSDNIMRNSRVQKMNATKMEYCRQASNVFATSKASRRAVPEDGTSSSRRAVAKSAPTLYGTGRRSVAAWRQHRMVLANRFAASRRLLTLARRATIRYTYSRVGKARIMPIWA